METDKKNILLEKARQIINDFNNTSLHISKLEINELNIKKFLPYIRVLEKELQLITEEIQQIQSKEEKEKKLIYCHKCEKKMEEFRALPKPITSLCKDCEHSLFGK